MTNLVVGTYVCVRDEQSPRRLMITSISGDMASCANRLGLFAGDYRVETLDGWGDGLRRQTATLQALRRRKPL